MIKPKEKNTMQINLRITNILHDVLVSESNYYKCTMSELIREVLNDYAQGKNKHKVTTVTKSNDSGVTEVFEFWKKTLNHPRSNLDDKRKALIRKHIKSGYSVEDLKTAILGCSNTPHNMGDNDRGQKYDSIELILRDSGQIDRFMNNNASKPVTRTGADNRLNRNLAAANAFMEDIK